MEEDTKKTAKAQPDKRETYKYTASSLKQLSYESKIPIIVLDDTATCV